MMEIECVSCKGRMDWHDTECPSCHVHYERVPLQCLACGKVFKRGHVGSLIKYCSRECQKEYLKNNPSWTWKIDLPTHRDMLAGFFHVYPTMGFKEVINLNWSNGPGVDGVAVDSKGIRRNLEFTAMLSKTLQVYEYRPSKTKHTYKDDIDIIIYWVRDVGIIDKETYCLQDFV